MILIKYLELNDTLLTYFTYLTYLFTYIIEWHNIRLV